MAIDRRIVRRRTDSLRPDPNQPRKHFDPDDLERLGQSILAVGQLNPVVIFEDGAIAFGERRWRAVKDKLEEIDCIVIDGCSEEELLFMRLNEDAHRSGLSDLEQGLVYERLVNADMPKKKIAERTHQAPSTITKKARLVTHLHPELRQAVEAEKLAPSVAYKLSQLRDAEKQLALGQRFLAGEIDHKEVARKVNAWKAGRETKADRPIRSTRGQAHGITVRFLGPNQIDEQKLQDAIEDALTRLRGEKAKRNGSAAPKKKGLGK